MVIFVPIERIRERYSWQWYDWFLKGFNKPPIVVGSKKEVKINEGQFLDVYDTNIYKLKQLQKIIYYLKKGFSGSIFFMDIWFVGLEALSYIRDAAKKNVKITGLLHAGTWDENDFLSQQGLERWAKDIENGWFEIIDRIIVATEYHKNLIVSKRKVDSNKIFVCPFPVKSDFRPRAKENIVVFPHRLAPEKQPQIFDKVAKMYKKKYGKEVAFVKTKEVCRTKKDYYSLLAKAKVVFSSALQETFGIAMLEGVNNGCVPVAPNRLSYRETLKEFPLYETLDEAVELIHKGITNYERPKARYNNDTRKIIELIL